MTDISSAIAAADFTKEEISDATTGLCGTFALALKQAYPDVTLKILCLDDKHGRPQSLLGLPYWRHVVATDGDEMFDITGTVTLKEMIDNYCWGNTKGKGGVLVDIEERELKVLLKAEDDAFDDRALDRWTERLQEVSRVLPLSPRTGEPILFTHFAEFIADKIRFSDANR